MVGPVAPGGRGRGVILGTAACMSPEQASGRPVDQRAHIWASGVVLHLEYDVAADGRRFAVAPTIVPPDRNAIVVENWLAKLSGRQRRARSSFPCP
jgi:hypothetical protein